ncbi:MAG: tRNA (adenosine(37)-N6)-threonylcarbamoyltransferase complex dimerization subunit type 1 TsaB [Candidatus Eremiobacteraeota bacterium]|nr:tRNA (adenosine(37)-N6)-threonylcarbamoyltransferase complex dimerization subunit type 1 TsaB [Candidatus Eremiobacteraeota bacterium]
MSVLWLGIDGALGPFSAALVARDDAGPPRSAAAAGKDALERGLGVIAEVLGTTALAELEGIAVGTGPGAFTGLRIALSYAKGLALAARLPLVGISSFDALEPAVVEWPSATFVQGRVGVVCVRLRTEAGEVRACGPYERVADEIAARIHAGSTLVSYGAAEGVTPALGERDITVLHIETAREVPASTIAHRAFAVAPADRPHSVQADYGEEHYASRAEFPAAP